MKTRIIKVGIPFSSLWMYNVRKTGDEKMPNKYDNDYKVQAIKLAKELGSVNQAARELGIPRDTLHGWFKAVREGRLDIGEGAHTPESVLTELIKLRKPVIRMIPPLQANERYIVSWKRLDSFISLSASQTE